MLSRRSLTHSLSRQFQLRQLHKTVLLQLDHKNEFLETSFREASIKEQNAINEVIDAVKNKRKLDKDSISKLLNPDLSGKQIVFSDQPSSISPLIEDLDEQPQHHHSSILISTEDIRKIPLSGTKIQPAHLTGLEKAIINVEEKEKLKLALEHALSPHLSFLNETIKTDKDLLDTIQGYLNQYLERSADLEAHSHKFLDDIQKRSESNPSVLPQPYSVTLPAVLRYLFESDNFAYPNDRKYNILCSIYNQCKSCKDLSLYLNVCTVDFYNLLLKYVWSEYQDLAHLKDIIYEMDANGIRGDVSTTEILEDICAKVTNISDSIIDDGANLEKSSILWCRENVVAVDKLNGYLSNLKHSLT